MKSSTYHPLHAHGLKRGRGTWVGLILGVFELDFDVLNATRLVFGTLKVALYTEAGILVFDMGG